MLQTKCGDELREWALEHKRSADSTERSSSEKILRYNLSEATFIVFEDDTLALHGRAMEYRSHENQYDDRPCIIQYIFSYGRFVRMYHNDYHCYFQNRKKESYEWPGLGQYGVHVCVCNHNRTCSLGWGNIIGDWRNHIMSRTQYHDHVETVFANATIERVYTRGTTGSRERIIHRHEDDGTVRVTMLRESGVGVFTEIYRIQYSLTTMSIRLSIGPDKLTYDKDPDSDLHMLSRISRRNSFSSDKNIEYPWKYIRVEYLLSL